MVAPRPFVRRVAGFSVMEAIIVLAITGLALTLVFSIGSRASETGFRLGRRALGVADTEISTDSFRSLVEGIVLPPFDMPVDETTASQAFHGDAQTLTGALVAPRATACSEAGPEGRVTLTIGTSGSHTALLCSVQGRPAVMIADLGLKPARFSYSTDGLNYADSWNALPGPPATGMPGPNAQFRRVFVHLANDDGTVQAVALASTGRPVSWAVFDHLSAMK